MDVHTRTFLLRNPHARISARARQRLTSRPRSRLPVREPTTPILLRLPRQYPLIPLKPSDYSGLLHYYRYYRLPHFSQNRLPAHGHSERPRARAHARARNTHQQPPTSSRSSSQRCPTMPEGRAAPIRRPITDTITRLLPGYTQ